MAITNAHKGAMLAAIGTLMRQRDISAEAASGDEYQTERMALFNATMVGHENGPYHMVLDDLNLIAKVNAEALVSSDDLTPETEWKTGDEA